MTFLTNLAVKLQFNFLGSSFQCNTNFLCRFPDKYGLIIVKGTLKYSNLFVYYKIMLMKYANPYLKYK